MHLINMIGKHGLRDSGGLLGFDIHIGIHWGWKGKQFDKYNGEAI